MSVRFPIAAVLALLLTGCPDDTIGTRNSPPSATIVQPTDGSSSSETEALELVGVVVDQGTPASNLRVTWTSSESGLLFDGAPDDEAGNTRFLWEAPEAGQHRISLSVIDGAGVSDTAFVDVTVIGNTAPTCGITAPSGDEVLGTATEVLFQGQVDDAESAATELSVVWTSDLDGELDTTSPTAGGVVSGSAFLSAGQHEITLEVTDPGGQACTDTLDLEMNAAPSTPEIELQPEDPTTLDDLLAAVIVASEDPEGTDVTYTYSWFEDGSASAVTGDSVLAADLDKGEVWTVDVRAVDGDGFSSASAQASVTIVNSPPSAPQVAISPAGANQAEDLTCSVTSPSTDADGDAVTYAYSWQVGGSPTGLTGATLSWIETGVGELWTCTATPGDGEDSGTPGVANETISAGCASLDVGAGEATVPDAAPLRLESSDFTVEAWVRATTTAAGETIAIASKRGSPGDGWHFGVGGLQTSRVRKPVFQVSDSDGDELVGTQVIPINNWAHVALTYDSGSGLATTWVNGANTGSATLPAPSGGAGIDLVLGADALGGGQWVGQLDDIRVSDVVRYSAPFVPASQLGADADTVAWWGFEEAAGAIAKDLSAAGHDAALTNGAVLDASESTCSNDQAPTAPVVQVTPEFPLLSQDLSCALVTPSVDPEGNVVTYDGQWLLNGAPSGVTFSSFPASLPSAFTSEGDAWTCSVVADDGVQTGPAGTDLVWTGAMPVGELVVTDPANPSTTGLTFTPPMAGMLRATLSNPDASRDGVFTVQTLGYGTTWVFTGYRDWAYGGTTVAGWASTDVEFNVDPSLGTLTINLVYDPAAGIDNAGIDTLELEFVYDQQLDLTTATFITGSDVGPQDTSVSQAQVPLAASERLLLEVGSCGFGGGGHGIYADTDGITGNDGIARVDTGFTGDCLIPLESRPIGAGTWTFTLVNEDDLFSDNTDPREVNLYRYVP